MPAARSRLRVRMALCALQITKRNSIGNEMIVPLEEFGAASR